METTDKIISIKKDYFNSRDISAKLYGEEMAGYIIETEKKRYVIGIELDYDMPGFGVPGRFIGSNGSIALNKNVKDYCNWQFKEAQKSGYIILDEDEVLEDYIGAEIIEVQLDGEGFELVWESLIRRRVGFIDFKTTKGVLNFCIHNDNEGEYEAWVIISCVDKDTNECLEKFYRV